MKVLVTGGAGFLGSHLCDALLNLQHEVICVDNLLTGQRKNISHLIGRHDFRFAKQDVCQTFDPGPFDRVFHLASPESRTDRLEYGLETMLVGAQGTINVLELAGRYGARCLMASSAACYGDPRVHPQPERYWGNVNPVGPRSAHEESKRFMEALTMTYRRYRGVDTRIGRIFNTYGPRLQPSDSRVIPTLMRQAIADEPMTVFGDGSQTRSFCYVSDQIDGLLRLMDAQIAEPVNIGNPEEITILSCAGLIREVVGSRSEIVFEPLPKDEAKQRKPVIDRASYLLNWRPSVELREGLERMLFFEQGRHTDNDSKSTMLFGERVQPSKPLMH